jgi:DNA-binding MarR family transcriptional regulator
MSLYLILKAWDDLTIESRGELLVMLAVGELGGDSSEGTTLSAIAGMVRMRSGSVRRILRQLILAGRVERIPWSHPIVSPKTRFLCRITPCRREVIHGSK